MQNDEILVKAYIMGDMQGFRILYQRYHAKVFFLIKRYIHQDMHAEEVFQEVFMKVIGKLATFDASGSFKAWLFAITRNHCIDRLRALKRRPEHNEGSLNLEDSCGVSLIDKHASNLPDAAELNYEKELCSKLNAALATLPAEQMEVFILKTQWEMSFEEIAKNYNTSVNTVKSRMRYALQTLRRNLKAKAFIMEARNEM